jgi:hypothetical protein
VASATEATWVRRNMESASIPNSSSKCRTRFTVTGRGRFSARSTSRRLSHQSCWALVALLTSTSYKLLFQEVHTSVLLQIKLFSRLHIESRDLLFQKPRALQDLKAS